MCGRVPAWTTHSHPDRTVTQVRHRHFASSPCSAAGHRVTVLQGAAHRGHPAQPSWRAFYSTDITQTYQVQPTTYIESFFIHQLLHIFVSHLGTTAPRVTSPSSSSLAEGKSLTHRLTCLVFSPAQNRQANELVNVTKKIFLYC